MRPIIWFLLVAGVPQVGVAVTLAHPALDRPEATPLVYLAGGAWAAIAWRTAGRWEADTPAGAWRWVKWCYVAPLVACFGFQRAHDPTTVAAFLQLVSPAESYAARSDFVLDSLQPAASPVRNGPTAGEAIALLRHVRDRFVRYALQLVVCVPPPWWVAAALLTLWKGKVKR